jgi:hypothetical protein
MLLLINLPPTDSSPLADYLPYLNLLRELLREHSDQILSHPITISVKPGGLVLLKDLLPSPLGLQWTCPHLVILTTPTAVKLNGDTSQETEKQRREVEDSWNPLGNNISQWFSWLMLIVMPVHLALLFLSFLPCIILHVCYC